MVVDGALILGQQVSVTQKVYAFLTASQLKRITSKARQRLGDAMEFFRDLIKASTSNVMLNV